ncbi:hypothetical protein [Marinomonas sp. GJ51-6]|uniref:hypothetical protein n=1 Tax=Marinomonas sp. GJ51-6 TaxID=2992802 RepID=UPI00293530AB|nr:hypothetical protein [Marinomonas sp. GJ51-6]WOD06178.1 hypothetical protein ONZ50_10550 [Marinomonas sp. GJ51-6]
MFVLIVSESLELLREVVKSPKLSNRQIQTFGTTLLPPNGELGVPLTDPFNVLHSFDFSNKLVFPSSTVVVHLEADNGGDGVFESTQSFSPLNIQPLYKKAFANLFGAGDIRSSVYLNQLKSIKQSISDELVVKLDLLREETGYPVTSFLKQWTEYCLCCDLPLLKLPFCSNSVELVNSIVESCTNYIHQYGFDSESKLIINKVQQSCEFTMPYSSMGFGDFYQRLERLYNFTKTVSNFKFVVEPYVNPHSKELDFNALVSITGDVEGKQCSVEKTIEIADFYSYILSPSYDNSDVKFNVIMGPGRALLNKTDALYETQYTFINRLDLKIPELKFQPFTSKESLKVIYHMRRHDTALKAFSNIMPKSMRNKLGVERPLLDYSVCDLILDSYINSLEFLPSNIEIVVISDGVDALEDKYHQIKENISDTYDENLILAKFNELRSDLNSGVSVLDNATVTCRILGRDRVKTLESVKAIAEADFVITSSGFSIFIARIAKADYVNGFTAIPMIEKGVFDFSSIVKSE